MSEIELQINKIIRNWLTPDPERAGLGELQAKFRMELVELVKLSKAAGVLEMALYEGPAKPRSG